MLRLVLFLGLLATYALADTSMCTSIIEYNADSDVIHQLSGEDNRSPKIKCYRINPIQPHDSIELDIESYRAGPNDYLKVIDGNDTTGRLLHLLSGSFGYISPVFSTSGSLFLQFTTNTQNSAWNATYYAYSFCKDRAIMTNASGVITDGSRGRSYQNNADCSWLIAPVQAGADFSTIQLNFSSFETADSGDIVSIYDGTNRLSPLLAQLHGMLGNDIPPIYTTGKNAFVTFTSNSVLAGQGWELKYTASYCRLDTEVEAKSGLITDGSGPRKYAPDTHCSWKLNPHGKYKYLKLEFPELHIKNGKLLIYNGAQIQNNLVGSIPVGTASYPTIYTQRKEPVIVKFDTTSSTDVDEGWTIKYTGLFCHETEVVTKEEGFIGDGSDNEDYEAGSECSWTIPVHNDFQLVNLDMVYFSAGPGDNLVISHGKEANSSLTLVELSGGHFDKGRLLEKLRPTIGNSVFFKWTTKSSGKGWLFQYRVTDERKNPVDPLPPWTGGTGPIIIHPVDTNPNEHSGISTGVLIAVIVVVTLTVIALVTFAVLFYRYKKTGHISSIFSSRVPINVREVPSSPPSHGTIEQTQNTTTSPGLTVAVASAS